MEMAQTLPVMIKTNEWKQNDQIIFVPQIIHFKNPLIMKKVNRKIEITIRYLMQRQYEEQGFSSFDQMIGMYEIKTNERNVLSISFTNYAIANHAAHGLTLMKSLTFDLETGESKRLQRLFDSKSNYVDRISSIVKDQISERDIPVFEPFTSISPYQEFYVADKALIIYFAIYEITPYYVGFPMFPISIYSLEDIIKEGSILERLLP